MVKRSITLGGGGGGGVTLTVVDAVRDPPGPAAVIVYCVLLPGQTCRDPPRSTLPIPWSSEAWEAFADVQVRFEH
jgi:hypothetical protein